MGTLAYPYETEAQTKKLIRRLQRPTWPIAVITEQDGDEVFRTFKPADIPDFVDDDLYDELGDYVHKHPRITSFDGRSIIVKRLKAMLQADERSWRTKGQLTGSTGTGQLRSIHLLRAYLKLPPLPAAKPKQTKSHGRSAAHSAIPHHNPRRAQGLAKKLARPWMVRVMKDRYTDVPNQYRAVLTELERYIYDKELFKKLNQQANRKRAPFDIRPTVATYVKKMMQEEGTSYKKTGSFVYAGAHFQAVNILRKAVNLKELS